MNILTIPVRNCRRKWARTLLLLAVFSLGVTSIVSLNHVSREVGHSLEKKLTAFGANILIAPRTEALTVSYGGFSLGSMLFDIRYLDAAAVSQAAHAIGLKDRISAVAPKLVTMAAVGDTHVGLVGVDWAQEKRIKNYWAVQGRYPGAPSELLAGATAARKLGLAPGTAVTLAMGDGSPATATVAGVLLETGSEDDNVLLGALPFVQDLAHKPGQANFVEVAALCSGCPIEDIVAQLETALPTAKITALRHIVEQRMYSVTFVQRLVMTVSIVILCIACAMVGLSMLSSVAERKKEIGILRSLGYARRHIFIIFTAEALFIGCLAGLLGYVAGYAASFKILALLDITDTAALRLEPAHIALTVALIATVSVLSAAVPAFKASRVEPSEALLSL
ncbi:MAG: ABC transporter permease [Desulfovibrionaceae bacterium]